MKPTLSAEAYRKLDYMLNYSSNEIGGFGITTDDDPMMIVDIRIPKQEVSAASVDFTDMLEFDARLSEEGIYPCHARKMWIHTHPGSSASPSGVDQEEFQKMIDLMDEGDYVFMIIIAQKWAEVHCEIAYKTPMGVIRSEVGLTIEEEYNEAWKEEIEANVEKKTYTYASSGKWKNNKWKRNKWKGNSNQATLPGYLMPSKYTNNTVTKTKISSNDLASIFLEYDVDSVSELTDDQLKELEKTYGTGVAYKLDVAEQEFCRLETSDLDEWYDIIMQEHRAKGCDQISEPEWKSILKEYNIRKSTLVEYEEKNGRGS